MTNAQEVVSSPSAGPSTRNKPLIKPYPFGQNSPPPSALGNEAVEKGLREVLANTSAVVVGRNDPSFESVSSIYNGAVQCKGHAVVQPRNAEHVSKTIKFCRQHDLHLSVKAGGTGVHGRSVAGHVVLDLGLMQDIVVDLPQSGPSLYESFQASSKRPFVSAARGDEASNKRSAFDAMGADGVMGDQGRQKRDGSGDVDMRSSTGSGTPSSGSNSNSRRSSTPATSNPSEGSQGSHLPKDPRSNSDPTLRPTRTTYVNPSPTTTAANYPFVPTSFGGVSSSSSQYPSSFVNPLLGGQQLVLNTNPDPPSYTVITFGAGVHSKKLDEVTSVSPYGSFHIPTSAYPVGAGQFLLGGFGFLGRKHGLAMDCVVEAEVVLADGRIVWVGQDGHDGEFKDDEKPDDLWWAIRGAGSALGVVTRIRSKAYYVPSVYAGNFIFVFNPLTTPSLLRHVRDCVKGSPRSLYTNIIMTAGPPGTPAIVVIQLCFSGPRSEGEMYVQAIGSWTEDKCLFQDFSERTFSRQQVAVEEVLRDGRGRKWYIKSDMLKSLSDDVIDQTCQRFCGVPDGCTWLFEYTGGGAMNDVKDSCFPSTHRDSAFTVAALHQWSHTEPPPLDTKCVVSAEEWINEVIQPNSAGGPLPCFIQSPEQVPGAYGENYPRLKDIKRTFDPTHLFRHSMWPDADEEIKGRDNLPDGLPNMIDGEGELGDESGALEKKTQELQDGGETRPTPTPTPTPTPPPPFTSVKEHKGNLPTEARNLDGLDTSTIRAGAGAA